MQALFYYSNLHGDFICQIYIQCILITSTTHTAKETPRI